MKILILTVLVLLAGCASAKQVRGPGGGTAYEVKCGNAAKSKCREKAADVCPRGYSVLDRDADRYGDSTKVGNAGALEIRADTSTYMLIQCK
jgi:uncharacterized protein YceK